MYIVASSDARYLCIKKQKFLKKTDPTHSVFDTIFRISALLEMDEETRDKILENMTTERDLKNQFDYARKEGHAIGIEEVRVEGRMQGTSNI